MMPRVMVSPAVGGVGQRGGRWVLAACALVAGPLSAQTPRAIIDHVDRLLRGRSSRGVVEMTIKTAHWDRSLRLQIWSLGTEYSLVRILAPRKDAGTATLMVENNIWNYLPRVDRTIRIPPSLMGGSWMGSHFTNDDLVKESRLIEDYDIAISFDGQRNGEEVWEILLTPKPDAAVIWGSIKYEVQKRGMMPRAARYFDEDDELMRIFEFDDVRTLGGRLVPARMTVIPADKPEERTVVQYHELEFDIDIDQSFFSLQRLRSDRR